MEERLSQTEYAPSHWHNRVAYGALVMKAVVIAGLIGFGWWLLLMQCVYFADEGPGTWRQKYWFVEHVINPVLAVLCAPHKTILAFLAADALLVGWFAWFFAFRDDIWQRRRAAVGPVASLPHLFAAAHRATGREGTPHRKKYRFAAFGWIVFLLIVIKLFYFSGYGFE